MSDEHVEQWNISQAVLDEVKAGNQLCLPGKYSTNIRSIKIQCFTKGRGCGGCGMTDLDDCMHSRWWEFGSSKGRRHEAEFPDEKAGSFTDLRDHFICDMHLDGAEA
jgi:hypothetical protein